MQGMNQRITLPMNSLEKLKCTLCHGYLSIPPVDITKQVCGRCNTNQVHCEAYEEIAQFVLFPCIYPQCDETITWGDVEKHEEKCSHKTFLCPVEGCDTVYEMRLTGYHFQDVHKEFHLHEFSQIRISNNDLNRKVKMVYHIEFKQHQFLAIAFNYSHGYCYEYVQKRNKFGVFALNPESTNEFKFEITLYTVRDSKTVCYTQKHQDIILFDKRKHCLKCIDRSTCTAAYFHNHLNNFLPVDFNNVDISSCKEVSYCINITPVKKIDKPDRMEEVAKKVECPICTEYMIAPIYICEGGHSICDKCKEAMLKCPYCEAVIGDKRNFSLEQLVEIIKTSCTNSDLGCKFFGDISSLKKHEKECTISIKK